MRILKRPSFKSVKFNSVQNIGYLLWHNLESSSLITTTVKCLSLDKYSILVQTGKVNRPISLCWCLENKEVFLWINLPTKYWRIFCITCFIASLWCDSNKCVSLSTFVEKNYLIQCFSQFFCEMKPRSFLLDIFAIFFGISAWISINGLWVELPLMVQVSISV